MNTIDIIRLATVCGGEAAAGVQTTAGQLEALCAAGRKNPPANLTPDQACLAAVWQDGTAKGSTAGANAAYQRVIDIMDKH